MTGDANQCIRDHMPIVHAAAKRIMRRVPRCVALDDLIEAGRVGLWKAWKSFDGRGSFGGYAAVRVRGEMLDELRREDYMSRHRRDRDESFPEQISMSQLRRDDSSKVGLEGSVRDDDELESRDVMDRVCRGMSAEDHLIVKCVLVEGCTHREASRAIGVSESRVSQLKKELLVRLRARRGLAMELAPVR